MNDTGPLRFTISDQEAHLSLKQIVQTHGSADADDIIAHGGVWIDGRRVDDVTVPGASGAQVVLSRPPDGHYAEVVITSDDILYEDEWLLALNKRSGWYCGVIPWDLYGNALAALGAYLRMRDGGEPYIHMAHQLDRDTSGVLVFSRRPEGNARVHGAFKDRMAHKTYLCLCAGILPLGVIEVQTGHGRGRGGRFRVYSLDEVGQPLPGGSRVKFAHTRFTTLQQFDDATLVEASPLTGRTHQIRIHLAHLGHPLLGDARYDGPLVYGDQPLSGHLLHAAHLTIPHPATGAALTFSAPLPELFARLGTTKDESHIKLSSFSNQ